jgi:uncharacterized membrane protein
MDHLQNELKKEFQVERMILFSDAVFAIAITLLVIDLKIPDVEKKFITETKLVNALAQLIPQFISFLFSFFIIGLFWIVHHRMFGFVVNYSRKLLVLNLAFLLGVILMPFSLSFYSRYSDTLLNAPVIIYAANICFIGIMNIIIWSYISNPKNKLSEGLHPLVTRYIFIRSTILPVTFLVVAVTYIFISPQIAIFIPMITPIIINLVSLKTKKKIRQLNIQI